MNNFINSPLPIYTTTDFTNVKKQQRFRNICSRIPAYSYTALGTPPIYWIRDFVPDVITAIRLFSIESSSTIALTIGDQYNNAVNVDGEYKVITMWSGVGTAYPCGEYYYEIECGTHKFYSDVFSVNEDLDSSTSVTEGYCKLVLKGDCLINNIPFDDYLTQVGSDFEIDIYLPCEPIVPTYSDNIEEEENEAGQITLVSRRVDKEYLVVAPRVYQPLADFLNTLRSYLVNEGSITIQIPNDLEAKTIKDIQVSELPYVNECEPGIKLRIQTEDNFVGCCETTPDNCDFATPRPSATDQGSLEVLVSCELDEWTWGQLQYRQSGSPSPFTVDPNTYTGAEWNEGITFTMPSANTYEYKLEVFAFNCSSSETATETETVT